MMDVIHTDENQNDINTELAIESDQLLPLDNGVMFEMPTLEVFDWNTSLVCQVGINQLKKKSFFTCDDCISFVEKVMLIIYECLLNLVNSPSAVRNMRLRWPIDSIWKRTSRHYIMQHVINV